MITYTHVLLIAFALFAPLASALEATFSQTWLDTSAQTRGGVLTQSTRVVSLSDLKDVSVCLRVTHPNGFNFGECKSIGSIAASEPISVSFSARVPNDAPIGTYRVRTSIFQNNPWTLLKSTVFAPTVTVAETSAAPDTTTNPAPPPSPAPLQSGLSQISVSQNTFAAGQTIRVRGVYTSAGAVQNANILFQIIDSNYAVISQATQAGQNFNAGETRSYDLPMAIPGNLAAGTYYLSVGAFNSSYASVFSYLNRVLTLQVSPMIVTQPKPPAPTPSGTGTLIFSDEFDGDLSKWIDHEPWQNAPGYLSYGTSWYPVPSLGVTASIADGIFRLKNVKCPNPVGAEMCGASFTTRGRFETFVHGRVEARVKVPNTADSFPAFWLMGTGMGDKAWPKTGEIDIFEFVGNSPATVNESIPFFTVHWYCPQDQWGHCSKTYEWPAAMKNYANDFHIWSLTRTADLLEVKIDGVVSARITRADLAAIGGNYDVIFNEPMMVLLDLASGGDWANDPSRPAQEGEMLVDYVRVYSDK